MIACACRHFGVAHFQIASIVSPTSRTEKKMIKYHKESDYCRKQRLEMRNDCH